MERKEKHDQPSLFNEIDLHTIRRQDARILQERAEKQLKIDVENVSRERLGQLAWRANLAERESSG